MKSKIDEALKNSLNDVANGQVKEAMLYSLLAGGKRVRPILFLKACEGYKVDTDKVMNAALALEYVHTYSLIHDDLPAMDNDDYRRGNLTCHKKYDEAIAILAGDALLTEAFNLICTMDVSDSIKVKLVALLSHFSGVRGMIKGQELDMYDTNESTIMKMDELKTGCLLSLPMMMASIIAGKEKDLDRWNLIGNKFGVIFQIQDDILDVMGNSEELGKATNSDEKNNKVTYMNLYGYDKCIEIINEKYNEIERLSNSFTNDFDSLFCYLKELGSRTN